MLSKNNFVSILKTMRRRKASPPHSENLSEIPGVPDGALFLLLEGQQHEEEESVALDIWLRPYHLLFPPSVVPKQRSVGSRLETEARLKVTTEPC